MKKIKVGYTISVLRGDGVRGTRGRYKTKAEAKKALQQLIKSRRSDADTRNPRIKEIIRLTK